ASEVFIKAMKSGNKVLFCGNGGSAADSQHVAAEFIGRFQKERQALPAIALTTDSSILTCLSNDYNYDIVFSRQIEALGKEGDVLFGISTSGNSKNVIEAVKASKKLGMVTITLTGGDGGELAKLADVSLVVPSKNTARIQESHLCIEHTICEIVEESLAE
ncbi:MAG: D-sedoheptulose 7-phosphate isomerase, partial [Candidatus Omnitrophota bacterium]